MMYSNSVSVASLIIASLLWTNLNIASAVDKTLEERASGKDVVEAVVEKIRRANFPDDSQFIRRLAYVETKDGVSNLTYYPATKYAGIWNVNESFYNKTKDPSLSNQHAAIQSAFNIAWANTTQQDLLKPLYSGLAARLYIDSIGQTIPQKLTEQALFWAQHYNSHDSWTNQDFVNQTEEYENSTVPCNGKMDLVVVLDSSGSIEQSGRGNYETCKQFLAEFFGSFSLDTARLGLVLFSTEGRIVFNLDNNKTSEQIQQDVLNLEYLNGYTNTNDALLKASQVFNGSEPRDAVPRIAAIFTDGESNPAGVQNIELLRKANVTSYAVGITNSLNEQELTELAQGTPTNVYKLNNFDVLLEFFKRLTEETCRVPHEPLPDQPIQDVLTQGQRRYYSISIPSEGLTLGFRINEGEVMGYWSRTERNPSSAMYDGMIDVQFGTFIPANDGARDGEGSKVYVTIEGISSSNNYTIEGITGDEGYIPPSVSTPPPGTTPPSVSTPPPVTSSPPLSTPAPGAGASANFSMSLVLPPGGVFFAFIRN